MESLARLQKIGIHNLFEAILCPPKSYTNTFLLKKLSKDSRNDGVVHIKVLLKSQFNRILRIRAFMLDFDEALEIMIFNAKPFHNHIFAPNKSMYILGTFEYNMTWHINQPKVITNINNIIMNFPPCKMQSATLNDIFRDVINMESLLSLGLNQDMAKNIWIIFHPESSLRDAPEYLPQFAANHGLFGEYLEAIKFVEIFYYMKTLREKKSEFLATHTLSGSCESFIQSLPFSLTKGQHECIATLSEKLHSTKATRCVVMGDVGCGKTIVILSCVMIAYPQKSLLLAPTTILAKQLYNEAKKFLPPFVRVGLAMGDSKKDSKENSKQECDFLIGTHALLYDELSDFALFMTDEQHRFGTTQRQKIEQMLSFKGAKPHSIQFSATPIPRTMAMIESNIVDFCFIKDLPFEKNITTKIITKSDFSSLLAHIKEIIASNQQVAIIYPLVEKSDVMSYQSIEEGLGFWQRNFEGVYFTHGRDKQKEDIIEEFAKEGNILIATTLFEVGISLPRLSVIVVVGAERLGFATLHQLRGRVSRNGLQGYCYLYTHTPDSARLRDFVNTTNGFEIAELDLQYRNSGDILRGIRQSGMQFKYFNMTDDKSLVIEAQNLLDSTNALN